MTTQTTAERLALAHSNHAAAYKAREEADDARGRAAVEVVDAHLAHRGWTVDESIFRYNGLLFVLCDAALILGQIRLFGRQILKSGDAGVRRRMWTPDHVAGETFKGAL